jgi:hypothetical protein
MDRYYHKLSDVNKEWINNYPKIIDANGCWIPPNKPNGGTNDEYVIIQVEKNKFYLHRLSMCLHRDLNYNDIKIETRHNTGCDKRCFNPEHLQPGTFMDNQHDRIRDREYNDARKSLCPKCQTPYKVKIVQSGWNRGLRQRYCPLCQDIRNRKRYHGDD